MSTILQCVQCHQVGPTATIKGPFGPHYAKEVCGHCGRFIKWLPRPNDETAPKNIKPDKGLFQ